MFDKEIIKVKTLPSNIINKAIYCIDQSNVNSYTHSFFKYPCKFIPEIPRWAINKYIEKREQIIFDPFVGSGTTVLESCLNGNNAFYTEIDEVANLITSVKTHKFSKNELLEINNIYEKIMKTYKNNDYSLPKIDNLFHWFPEDTAISLAKILYGINAIENEDYKNFFKVCFISILKKCSFCDDSSPKPYVSTKVLKKPANPSTEFKKTFEKYFEGEKELNKKRIFAESNRLEGDALSFTFNGCFDLVITSPPYINAFDYGRTLRLENIWLDLLSEDSLREKKAKYVGTEKINIKKEEQSLKILEDSKELKSVFEKISNVDYKRAIIVKKFFEDIKRNLIVVNKHLKENGHYVIVIGDSNIRKEKVESSKIISEIAQNCGYKLELEFSYIIQNPYINIPRNGKGGKIAMDNIIVLKKVVD